MIWSFFRKFAKRNRSRKITCTWAVGNVANMQLATFQAVVYITANSVIIVMDVVNNLNDQPS